MAAVHFTTIPCEPNAVNRHTQSHIFCEINPCINDIVYARFEVFRTFLCAFMSVFRVVLAMLRIMGKCISRYLFRYCGYQFGVCVQPVLFVIVRVTALQSCQNHL